MLLADDFARRARAALGKAHLAYWNVPEAGERLKRCQAWLDQPFPIAVEGGTSDVRATVEGVLNRHTEVQLSAPAPLGCLLLPGAEQSPCRPEATVALVPEGKDAWSFAVDQVRALVPMSSDEDAPAVEAALAELLRDVGTLRVTAVLDTVRDVVTEHPVAALESLPDELDEIEAEAPEPGEVALRIAVLRDGIEGLGPAAIERARQLFDADPIAAGVDLDAELAFWRAHAADRTLPLESRTRLAGLARFVERLLA